ncbi:MAG: hypothetical protein AB1742_07215 [bacterium]
MRKGCCRNALSRLFCRFVSASVLFFLVAGAAADGAGIERVETRLGFTDENVPSVIRERLQRSVQQVGDKALVGKTLEEAEGLRESLEKVMEKIFNEVMEGFRVDEVSLRVGRAAEVSVMISPTEPRVKTIRTRLIAPGVHDFWRKGFESQLRLLEPAAAAYIAGTPVGARSWAAKLFTELVQQRDELKDMFPGFDVSTELEMDEESVATVTLKAREPVIRWVTVQVRSHTIPAMALERLKYSVAGEADMLLGLPVEFAREQTGDIVSAALERFAETTTSKTLKLDYQVTLQAGRSTAVGIRVESRRFRGFARGKVSLGKEARNPDVEGHLGVFLAGRTELFTEFNFFPGPIDVQANLGIGRRFSPEVYGAVGKNVVDGISRIWVEYYLGDDVVIAWEKGIVEEKDEDIEGSVRFQVHDFFGIEVVTDFQKDLWFRFIVNL